MTRARGQSSQTLLDREFSHRVLVLAESVSGKKLDNVDAFHTARNIPTKKRSIRKDDVWWTLYCFAKRADAEAFRDLFGGEIFDRVLRKSAFAVAIGGKADMPFCTAYVCF